MGPTAAPTRGPTAAPTRGPTGPLTRGPTEPLTPGTTTLQAILPGAVAAAPPPTRRWPGSAC
ncbi:MAG: hypothetical protein M3Y59_06325 [Myxococcota bacterium]|nr:hypothetical protein [Myxococcota bacterium]